MSNYQLTAVLNKLIEYSFYALFFFVPLVLTPWNYELFEYNKMMLVYGLTTIITASWLGKMVILKRIILRKTPLDIPLALFFTFQAISFFFSIDKHVSFWGYYSRFHGGTLSTITFIILYYAFVSNFTDHFPLLTSIIKLLLISLASGLLVSLYGIFQHFGIDDHIWVQDVQNRIFSTLGQPNWLAAYLAVLIPISLAFLLHKARSKKQGKAENQRLNPLLLTTYFLLPIIFYLSLLYTKSRSGFIGLWIANLFFWTLLWNRDLSKRKKLFLYFYFVINLLSMAFFLLKPYFHLFWFINVLGYLIFLILLNRSLLKYFLVINLSFIVLTFIVGSPFSEVNRFFSISPIQQKFWRASVISPPTAPQGPALETGGTESGQIRRIVWRGAIDIARNFPLFGSGPETFAFTYYQFRPKEHNLTSEWDFLYNKAHNEYLNYLATTGFFGLASYLLLIAGFIWWNVKKFKIQNSNFKHLLNKFALCTLHFALFTAWLSILITNFFGFSVVIISLFFYLIPAFMFVLTSANASSDQASGQDKYQLSNWQKAALLAIFTVALISIFKLATIWLADIHFASGHRLGQANFYNQAFQKLKKAISLNPNEPFYHDEFSHVLATLALAAHEQDEATLSASLESMAINESNKAIQISPNNVNFYKTRARVFYALGQINEKYTKEALISIEQASKLAPSDVKVLYNLALIQAANGFDSQAIDSLIKAASLKPDYREPRYALALFYEEKGEIDKAILELNYILTNINPHDEQAREKLDELTKK